MKTTTLSKSQMDAFTTRIASIWGHYDRLNTEIEKIVNEHGEIWAQIGGLKVHPQEGWESEKRLIQKAKDIASNHMTEALAALFKIKNDYLEAVMPTENKHYDITELTIIEKEIAVMNDKELEGYYNEHWQDDKLSRLIIVEMKKREIAKFGNSNGVRLLSRDQHSDDFTKEIDETIQLVTAFLKSALSTFTYVTDPINRKFFSMPYETMFRSVRIRSHNGKVNTFKLSDLGDPNFGIISSMANETFNRKVNMKRS